MSNGFTPLTELGEFGLINRLKSLVPTEGAGLLAGIGDDAAVLEKDAKTAWLVSTDLFYEGVHFDLRYSPPMHLGYKMAATNFSDIYAMNGKPKFITISMAAGNRIGYELLEELYKGIAFACQEHDVVVIGGDTTSSPGSLCVSITVIGEQDKDKIVYRSGGQLHDVICVTGDLGAAYAGLQLLEREKEIYLKNPGVQPDLSDWDYVVERQLKPRARKDMVDWCAGLGIVPHAMIDISDGLASEVHHIASASNKGAVVVQDKLPIDWQTAKAAEEFGIPATTFALYGGEDYELLFTIPATLYEKVKKENWFAAIGYLTDPEEGVRVQLQDKSIVDLSPKGYNHFS